MGRWIFHWSLNHSSRSGDGLGVKGLIHFEGFVCFFFCSRVNLDATFEDD